MKNTVKITPNLTFRDEYLQCEEGGNYRAELVALSKEPNLSIATINGFKISGIEAEDLQDNLFEKRTETSGKKRTGFTGLPQNFLDKNNLGGDEVKKSKYIKKDEITNSTKQFLNDIKQSIEANLKLDENLKQNKSAIENDIIGAIQLSIRDLDNQKGLPKNFRKHILLTQIALIEKQLEVEKYELCQDQSLAITQGFQQALNKSLIHPLRVFNAQIGSIKTNNGQLNIALQNPAAEAFESQIKGVKIDDILSRVQLDALRSIDEAIVNSKSNQNGGKAVVRIGTGGGKTYLMDKINAQYVSKADSGINKIVSIDLNSSADDKAIFNNKDKLNGKLVILDEAFFYGTEEFNKDGIILSENESVAQKRNKIIQDLRNRGGVVIVVGASESLEKIGLEIARLKSKIGDIDQADEIRQQKINEFKKNESKFLEMKENFSSLNSYLSTQNLMQTKGYKLPEFVELLDKIGVKTKNLKNLDEIKRKELDINFDSSRDEAYKILKENLLSKLKEFGGDNVEYGKLKTSEIISKIEEITSGKSSEISKNFNKEDQIKRAALEERLNARQNQYDGLKQRRDIRAIQRLEDGEIVLPNGENDIDKIVNQLSPMQPKQRLQFIIPHIDLEHSLTQEDLSQIQSKTNAEIIIIPFRGDGENSKLGCKIYYHKDNKFCLSEKIEQSRINEKLKEFGLKEDSKLIAFFDNKNAIGGDYGDASLGITSQIYDISGITKLTTNHLMQFNRNRGADKNVDVTVVSSDRDGLTDKIKQNSQDDDKERLVGYLENKLLDESKDIDKKNFYQKYLNKFKPTEKKTLIEPENYDDEISTQASDVEYDNKLKNDHKNDKLLLANDIELSSLFGDGDFQYQGENFQYPTKHLEMDGKIEEYDYRAVEINPTQANNDNSQVGVSNFELTSEQKEFFNKQNKEKRTEQDGVQILAIDVDKELDRGDNTTLSTSSKESQNLDISSANILSFSRLIYSILSGNKFSYKINNKTNNIIFKVERGGDVVENFAFGFNVLSDIIKLRAKNIKQLMLEYTNNQPNYNSTGDQLTIKDSDIKQLLQNINAIINKEITSYNIDFGTNKLPIKQGENLIKNNNNIDSEDGFIEEYEYPIKTERKLTEKQNNPLAIEEDKTNKKIKTSNSNKNNKSSLDALAVIAKYLQLECKGATSHIYYNTNEKNKKVDIEDVMLKDNKEISEYDKLVLSDSKIIKDFNKFLLGDESGQSPIYKGVGLNVDIQEKTGGNKKAFVATIKNIMSPELGRFFQGTNLEKPTSTFLNEEDTKKSLQNQQITKLTKKIDGKEWVVDLEGGKLVGYNESGTQTTEKLATKQAVVDVFSYFCRGVAEEAITFYTKNPEGVETIFTCQKDNRAVFIGGEFNTKYDPQTHGMYNVTPSPSVEPKEVSQMQGSDTNRYVP